MSIKGFVPHVVLETEFTRPTSIWAASVMGVSNLLTIPLDTRLPAETYLRQALKQVPASVPYFGRVKSFVINMKDGFACRHSCDGTILDILDACVTVGQSTLSLDRSATRDERLGFAGLVGMQIDTLATIH